MFDILFGWRKASKCKKLIKRVQCRLKLLKNKRCSIVRQLREDVAQLLSYGHEQNAFDRVEQIFKDESIVTVYDLLDHFCEFIIIHLPYIRKHKDCPSDINEAVSSLVFASARCGDLPELVMIRRLFGECYGQRFTKVALELLPGNLVNLTIRENLSIKSVPNDVKYNLVDEIAWTSCLQTEPLALEYTSEWRQQQQLLPHSEIQENKSYNKGEIIPDNGIYASSNRCEESQRQASNITKDEGKTVRVDFSSAGKRTLMKPIQYIHERCKKGEIVEESSSSESSSDHMPEEMVYLDDIEEFQSPMNKDGKFQDQRLFMFKPSIIPTIKKFEVGYDGELVEKYGSMNEKAGSRSSRKSRKEDGNRLRKRSFSLENRIVNDIECAIYYGNLKKTQMKGTGRRSCYAKLDHPSGEMVSNCSLEKPCYVSASDDVDDSEIPPLHGTCNGSPINMEEEGLLLVPQSMRDKINFLDDLLPNKRKTQLEEESEKVSPWIRKGENQQTYLRAMTMPPERPKDIQGNNFLRSNSFPFQQPSDLLSNAYSTSPHVHPKLPDYDELAAKFMALKKEVLQKKNQESKQ